VLPEQSVLEIIRVGRSEMCDVGDSLGEARGRFLGRVVTDWEYPVLILAGGLVPVCRAVPRRRERVVCAVNGDRGHRNDRSLLRLVLAVSLRTND
jgi:hypothetical protein